MEMNVWKIKDSSSAEKTFNVDGLDYQAAIVYNKGRNYSVIVHQVTIENRGNGITSISFELFAGKRATLFAAQRASKKQCETACDEADKWLDGLVRQIQADAAKKAAK